MSEPLHTPEPEPGTGESLSDSGSGLHSRQLWLDHTEGRRPVSPHPVVTGNYVSSQIDTFDFSLNVQSVKSCDLSL